MLIGSLAPGVLLREVGFKWVIFPWFALLFANPHCQWKAEQWGQMAGEITGTILTNGKPRNIDQIQAIYVIKPTWFPIEKKNHICF